MNMNMFGQGALGPGGPGALFAQLAAGMGGGQGYHAPPRAYDEYLKAYSVAMLPGRERANVSFGGKIIMPPSALANLTSLNLESPWMFQLRNPSNPAASTHAGVLEFIAEEGVVHLPYWMMKTLRLNEGDPIRITGAQIAKGKRVKLQAQTVDFLEISDPKAVLEQALRNFTALTQGDMIEISYNSITFQLLIMEILPEGPAISILDTDLEVDFAAPKGYVEPARPDPKPQPTMASKLKIDLNDTTPGSSRPASSLASVPGVSKGGTDWESFKGRGETLSGRKTKGRGITARKIDDVQTDSKIYRTDKPRMMTNDELDSDVKVPAALNLPPGKLFFGFTIVPYKPSTPDAAPGSPEPSSAPFTGSGNTLSGRPPAGGSVATSGSSLAKGKTKSKEAPEAAKTWGSGQTLGRGRTTAPQQGKQKQKQKERSPTPDWGVDDDDVIAIDSD
ncbi:ubiquitin fusion degradation protein I [Gautieria morchelliformis]|nr:ubiquitin fusion degradation protein I [Gautieria morchelliformis]